MNAFVSRKRKRDDAVRVLQQQQQQHQQSTMSPAELHVKGAASDDEEESTELKLALLASLHPDLGEAVLLDALLVSDGSVAQASACLSANATATGTASSRKRPAPSTIGYQSSLASYRITPSAGGPARKPLVKKGQTLYLYAPEDIEAHTPCSIIHNFLPSKQADALLLELLEESPTYTNLEFKLFDRVVKSPHTFCFYVNSLAEVEQQKTEYTYDGRKVEDVRQSLPEMLKACPLVEEAVNNEIQRRIRDFYPGGQKLKYQSPNQWKANTAFVNCYDGPQENVGYHSDHLTYLGPRAVIGSLSLGVAREFRVRKILAEDEEHRKRDGSLADAQGQISIHLPHNSLLVMHADMQEEWKHSIAPAQAIDPHPLAKNKRLNITYRCYKDNLHPKYTPRCRCGAPTVLRCVTRKKETRGRYMWMCYTSYSPGEDGCSFFQWAEFDDDGEPPWAPKGEDSLPAQTTKEEGTLINRTLTKHASANSRTGTGVFAECTLRSAQLVSEEISSGAPLAETNGADPFDSRDKRMPLVDSNAPYWYRLLGGAKSGTTSVKDATAKPRLPTARERVSTLGC